MFCFLVTDAFNTLKMMYSDFEKDLICKVTTLHDDDIEVAEFFKKVARLTKPFDRQNTNLFRSSTSSLKILM